MIPRHHVGDDLLLGYEAGTLAEGWSLAVATHLAYCPQCRARARAAAAIGGALLESVETAPLGPGALAAARARIEALSVEPPPAAPSPLPAGAVPAPLSAYIGNDLDALAWKRLGTAAHQFMIPTGDGTTSARLLRIPGGEPVPEHGHRGLELTLVLRGTLVDADQRFAPGDIEEADDTLEHQPRAGEGEECICLAVTDAPLRFKSLIVRLAQPFLKI